MRKQFILLIIASVTMVSAYSATNKVNHSKSEFADLQNRVKQLEGQVNNNEKHLAIFENKYARPVFKYISPSPLSVYGHSAFEEQVGYSNAYLTGYASVGFIDVQHNHSQFFLGNFNPTFIFNYQDLFQWESMLEFTMNTDGTTNTSLAYGYLDWFVTNHITLVGGKFYSPIGKFENSLYPDWINKLPSKPVGFYYANAAPVSDVGVQVRGDIPLQHNMQITYVLFGANGPIPWSDSSNFTYVDSNGTSTDQDGHKIWGGRIGFLPTPSVDLGISAALGQAGIINTDNVMFNTSRTYSAFDLDANYSYEDVDLRAEYVQQLVQSQAGSEVPGSAKWSAWYTQAAYKILHTKWEGVLRVGSFASPDPIQKQRQLAVGINYWFSPTIVAKTAYAVNRGQQGNVTDANDLTIEFAYGF